MSRDAGMYLHWSGDSRASTGRSVRSFYTRDLSKTFTFVDQSLEKPDPVETKGVPIGFSAPSDEPDGVRSRSKARASSRWTRQAPRGGVIENGTIVVRGNRIEAVGPSGRVRVPAGATRVDARGRTIIPGLIDVHAHVNGENDGILAEESWPLVANLAYGVTTAHDPSNDTETVFANSELVRAGLKLSPRLFSTGTILYGAELPVKAVVENYDDAAGASAPDEGRGRVQRQELQPAAARRPADDPEGRARAADDGRPRGRVAARISTRR